ncbi:MAG TPA: PQQ-binding-like beta-propeller repeat protein, partial [Verrucomicrobiae bacterium]
ESANIKWKVEIPGSGRATPIIWGHQVFIQTAIPTTKKVEPPKVELPSGSFRVPSVVGVLADPPPGDRPERRRPGGGGGGGGGGFGGRGGKPTEMHEFALLCLDRQTGKTLWQKTAREELPHEGHHPDGSFSSYSPVTDGQHIYAYFGSRGLYCYDMAGQLQWSQNFGQQHIIMGFGEGSSPALYGDTIIVNWDNEGDSFIIALDKTTGKTRWKQSRDERTSWATPLVVEHEGKAQVVTAATRKIRSYDLTSGKLIWECGGLTPNVIPTPVAGDGMVYPISGFRGSSLLAVRLGRTGDLTGTDAIAWQHNKNTPYVPSPLLYGGKLYFFSNNNGVLSCIDAKSGRPLIEAERLEALPGVYASPLGASGRIYLAGRNGTTLIIKNSDRLEVLATNKLEEKFDASPAAVGQELFLRGHQFLYCIAEK